MSKAIDRPAWGRDEEAPISYRLPSSRKKVKAGGWSAALLILLSLALLGCGLAEGARKRQGAKKRTCLKCGARLD